jgi:hypothetical protein
MQKYPAADPSCSEPNGVNPGPCWVITSTGTSPNGKESSTVTETIYWHTTTIDEQAIYQYGLVVFNQPGNCVTTHGGSGLTLTIRDVWIGGDFCPQGSDDLLPGATVAAAHTGSIYIGGTYQGRNAASIGTQSIPYHSQEIVGGCTVQGKPQVCSDSASSNVWADGPPGADPSILEKPDINALGAYNDVSPNGATCTGPGANYFASGGKMDGNGSMDQSLGTVTLFPSGGSFSCTESAGTLAWNSSTSTLTISGKVFIDGNVDLSNGGSYAGNGTIYINGTVSGAGNIAVCGPWTSSVATGYGCPHTWDATKGTLGLVVINPTNQSTAFKRNGNGELDVSVLVNQGYADTGGTAVLGPVIADTATIGGSSGQIVPAAPATGMPTTVTTSAAWVVQPGSWKQSH